MQLASQCSQSSRQLLCRLAHQHCSLELRGHTSRCSNASVRASSTWRWCMFSTRLSHHCTRHRQVQLLCIRGSTARTLTFGRSRHMWSLSCNAQASIHAQLINNNNLQAFQLIVLARYLLGVPNPQLQHPKLCMGSMYEAKSSASRTRCL